MYLNYVKLTGFLQAHKKWHVNNGPYDLVVYVIIWKMNNKTFDYSSECKLNDEQKTNLVLLIRKWVTICFKIFLLSTFFEKREFVFSVKTVTY